MPGNGSLSEQHLTQVHPSYANLGRLPREVRIQIYTFLLVSQTPDSETYGRGSMISTAILSSSRGIYQEAVDILYSALHRLTLPTIRPLSYRQPAATSLPSYITISRMTRIELHVPFSTLNRGECETTIKDPTSILLHSDPLALTLLRSTTLTSLAILLLNSSHRKRGANHFRSKVVLQQVKRIMYPFAYLRRDIAVEVAGFDTLDYAELFEELRDEFAGKPAPIQELLDDALAV